YVIFHGAAGIKNIAKRVHLLTLQLDSELTRLGIEQLNACWFDTLKVKIADVALLKKNAEKHEMNFNYFNDGTVGISLDETTTSTDVNQIVRVFEELMGKTITTGKAAESRSFTIPEKFKRTSSFLLHPVFNSHRSETQMMRYIKFLENKDLSLNTSMISLGSCTMKLNAASELIPVSWTAFSRMHPFAPADQTLGYQQVITELENYLSAITGFAATSLQPNSGAQGEFSGLLTIKAYHASRNEGHRNVVLIPISAHGTNPASAVMAGMKVVVTKCDEAGNIDLANLAEKADEYKNNLAALMVTYPSTHGVFEESIREICDIIHHNGGLVYMDGANMNAQVGLTSPGMIGADVCHLNLHKTFSIPHGGGGPGVGPICVAKHLVPFLPGHVKIENGVSNTHAVSAAPYGSASILLISYAYIKMLGVNGIRNATEYAILNANYMKVKLEKYYKILYTGKNGTAAHEFIVDLLPFKTSAGIEAEDVAKRLMDYGFHAPTLSFPVAGTLMIEPTESEDKAELDRFCEALISIYHEINAIEGGLADKKENVLKNAPHTMGVICADEWKKPYTRQQAAFPLPYVKENKFWPGVSRVNNTYGDRNLVCTCEPTESYLDPVLS
ncbi:MAG: aminomethyl-transferring glycine dehydrogenase, partial [Ferruginibacter sp.]